MEALKLSTLPNQLIEPSMRVRAARHKTLSANIANVDTQLSVARYRFRLDLKSTPEMDDFSATHRNNRWSALDLQTAIYELTLPT